jgi:hypothetical protein
MLKVQLLEDPLGAGLADEPWLIWPEPADCPCCVDPRVGLHDDETLAPVCWSIPGVTGLSAATSADLPPVSPWVAQLQQVMDRVCNTSPGSLPAGQALADAGALLQLAQQLRVHNLTRIADVEARKLHILAGIRSTSSWIRDIEPDTAEGDPALGKQLRRYPHLRAELDARRLSLLASRRVSTCLEKLRRHLDRPDGMLDGQPAGPVLDAVTRHVVDQISQQQLGLCDTDPLLLELISATEAIIDAAHPEETSSSGSGDLGSITQLEQLEHTFALLGKHLPAAALAAALDEALCAVLPSTLDKRADKADQRAALHLERRLDGGWHLEGDLTDEVGELLHTCLHAEARRDPGNPFDTEAAQDLRDEGLDPYDPIDTEGLPDTAARPSRPTAADPSTASTDSSADSSADSSTAGASTDSSSTAGPSTRTDSTTREETTGDPNAFETWDPWHPNWDGSYPPEPMRCKPRSKPRRLHDALGRLLQRYLAADLAGSHDKRHVTITITVPAALIDDHPGAPPAKTGTGQLLGKRALARLLCGARNGGTISSYLRSRGWQVVGEQHSHRTLTATERRALDLQSGGNRCAGTGCCPGTPQPLTGLEPHHVRPWAQTRQTSLHDSIWACPALHHDLHHDRTVLLRNGRRLNARGWAA